MDKIAHRILVVNAKGGCGKTTIATNLAAYFARHQTTMLLDYDPQGSSMRWVRQRSDELPTVVGMRGGEGSYRPNVTRSWLMHNPDYDRTVIDAPAGVCGHNLVKLVQQADTILVPVQPSPIDIAATADFIRDLLLDGKIRIHGVRVGVIANRVKANTLVYQSLQRFLRSLGLPIIGALRDAQNYMRAAEEGMGIHELAAFQAKKDIQQWQSILRWLDRRLQLAPGIIRGQTAGHEDPVFPSTGVHTGSIGSPR